MQPPSSQSTPAYGRALAPSAVAPAPVVTRQRYSLVRDIYWGAIWGDFAPTVGIPGAVTQAVLGYVPVVGTITALRDAVADWRLHDGVGVVLNIFAAFPVLGGLAKTADVLHELHRLHRVYSSHRVDQQPDETIQTVAARRGLGCLAFLISLVVLTLGIFYGLGIHIAVQYARTSWPLSANTPFIGNGVLVVAVGLAALGLSIGEVICAGSRAWLGVMFLPAVMFVGLLVAGGI
jgi:hypothetical protein